MSTSTPQPPRVLALHSEAQAPSLALSRLIGALSAHGATVEAIPLPLGASPSALGQAPSLAEIKAGLHSLAESVGAALRGDPAEVPDSEADIARALRSVEGRVDAVVSTDARLAERVFGIVAAVWPDALCVAVEGDFHLDPGWRGAPFDAIVTPHPTLGAQLDRVREGKARLYAGGPIVATDGE